MKLVFTCGIFSCLLAYYLGLALPCDNFPIFPWPCGAVACPNGGQTIINLSCPGRKPWKVKFKPKALFAGKKPADSLIPNDMGVTYTGKKKITITLHKKFVKKNGKVKKFDLRCISMGVKGLLGVTVKVYNGNSVVWFRSLIPRLGAGSCPNGFTWCSASVTFDPWLTATKVELLLVGRPGVLLRGIRNIFMRVCHPGS